MTTWYVATTGSAGNAGSIGSPWSLDHARTGAGGQIVAGDTVVVQAGTYSSTIGYNFTVSSAGLPITFQASGTVILDGAYATPTWELYDAATNTYRTTAATYGVAKQGGHILIGSTWYPLATHQTLDDLMAATQTYSPTTNYYVGPGVAEEPVAGRLYVRLTPADTTVQYGRVCATPASLNPASVTLKLCGGQNYGITATGNNLVFDGFICNDFYSLIRPIGNGVTFRNISGRFIAVGMRTGVVDGLTLDTCTINGLMNHTDWWLAWLDCKGGRTVADEVRKAGMNIELGSKNITIRDCQIIDVFDGILSDGCTDVEVDGGRIDAWDDAWQMYSNLARINYHDVTHYGAGPSHDASGSSSANVDPGTVYVHHCIIDTTRKPMLWGRQGSEGTGNAYGFGEQIAVSAHGLPSRAVPWKIYHNTIVTGADQVTALLDVGLYGETATAAGVTHDVFNNIFVTTGQMRVSATAYADSGAERWDGNCYSGWTSASKLWNAVTPTGSLPRTLADLYTSAMFDASKASYAPGWEASGIAVDPRLDVSYAPTTASVMSGAVDLSATGWPGTTPAQPCRGAIAATAPTLDTVARAGGMPRRFV